MNEIPRVAILNPTCLDIIDRHRQWLESLDMGWVAVEEFKTASERLLVETMDDVNALVLPAVLPSFPQKIHMSKSPCLQTLALASTGYDMIDVQAATSCGIVVTNASVPEGVEVVADHVFGLALAVARQIPQHHRQIVEGNYQRGIGMSIWGKTLGIVGLGQIGSAVAHRARGFRMRLLATDPRPDPKVVRELGVQILPLRQMLAESDIVSLHVRLDSTTRNMMGRAELELMKPTAYLINTARQGLVDESALVKALMAKRLGGAGLDDPPLDPKSPLLGMPNVVFTPHMGNRAIEGMDAVFRMAINNCLTVLRREPVLT